MILLFEYYRDRYKIFISKKAPIRDKYVYALKYFLFRKMSIVLLKLVFLLKRKSLKRENIS